MNYWFISDQHFGHENIIKYCNRPFATWEEMDEELIKRHNEVVGVNDTVIHGGDLTLRTNALLYIRRLNGKHIFLKGSHDYWQDVKVNNIDNQTYPYIWEKDINGIYVVVCHYSMRTWPRSFHGSIQLYGHSHGTLPPETNQFDISADANNFYPVSFDQIITKLKPKMVWKKR